MKVTYNWLKNYVHFDWSPEELAQRLTFLGLEVENVQKIGGEFAGIVVAQVLTRDRHPNADKLSLCRVQDGKGERQIVCGAQNFKAGDKVPLILPGSRLPAKPGETPMQIKVGKIRGVESQGMLCSPEELGLPDKVDGLLILREDAVVGQPLAEYLGRAAGDVVYDLEVTPNRPDWNSVIGIAREISALTGNPLRLPEIAIPAGKVQSEAITNYLAVRVEEPVLCPRYTARLVRGVKIGPSPDWLRAPLEKAGLRSINNVVDVTNFVMLETGQPLHAFDFRLVAAAPGKLPTVVARRAAEGEEFTALDGKKHRLDSKCLLIADETKPIALAGIIGGQNSEIGADTVDVLIESACFQPQNIRATSKKLEVRTDSSYRFERGADIGLSDWAGQRAAQLILETAGGVVLEQALDLFPNPTDPKHIPLRFAKTDALLGLAIPPAQQGQFLEKLGLRAVEIGPDRAVFATPSFRIDLKREVDLIEEIARLYGVEKIPATPPRGALGHNAFDPIHDQLAEARRILTALGLHETQGQTLIAESEAVKTSGLPAARVATLRYPLSADMNALRPGLLAGLLSVLRHNVSRKNNDVAVFEIGRVFSRVDEKTVKEQRKLAMAITGARAATFWEGPERDARRDLFDLKGLLEAFFDQFGLRGLSWTRREAPSGIFSESATIQLGKLPLGEIGQLARPLARQYDLRDPVLLAELDLEELMARRAPGKSFRPLPQFPSIRRDVAMLLAESVSYAEVQQVVKQSRPANLDGMFVFDVFRGKNVPPGQKSLACAFIYRNPERTLTDTEVNAAQEKLVAQFKQSLQAVIRET